MNFKRVSQVFAFAACVIGARAECGVTFTLGERGSRICKTSEDACYTPAATLGLKFAPVEKLFPAVQSYAEWLAADSDILDLNARSAEVLGGAVLLSPPQTEAILTQLRALDVRHLGFQFDLAHPVQEGAIPFAVSVDWTDASGRSGTLDATGAVILQPGDLEFDLNDLNGVREHLASMILVQQISGDMIPLRVSGEPLSSITLLREVIGPMLAGKYIAVAQVGFNDYLHVLETKRRSDRAVLATPSKSHD